MGGSLQFWGPAERTWSTVSAPSTGYVYDNVSKDMVDVFFCHPFNMTHFLMVSTHILMVYTTHVW